MINKRAFIFNTLTEALRFKIGADPRNTTYRWGSFSEDATIYPGEPDIPYYSEILIRETNQIWRCNQFWLNDVHRDPTTDLVTERAERIAGDERLEVYIENQAAAITALGLRIDNLTEQLITMDEFRAISPKQFKTYFVAKDETDKAKMKCWRIYLRTQLIGEFDSSGHITLPKFPMRFPFRFA